MAGSCVLLDCTLRDGGYYNDWDFEPRVVERYLDAVVSAGVEVVEIGFRRPIQDRYLGPFVYTTDAFLGQFDLPTRITWGVMVNAKEVLGPEGPVAVIEGLFGPADSTPVSLVRFATNYDELEELEPAVTRLHELGYQVGVNLMQASNRSTEDFTQFGRYAESWDVEVAYFADSFGAIRGPEIPSIIGAVRNGYSGPIGCHMHDSMSLAMANSLMAVEHGAHWVDGTLLGMGRGPGNARTEYLAIELAAHGLATVDHLPLVGPVTTDFRQLHDEYGWGTNVFYFLSASYGIHPTYIQEMTRDNRYDLDEIVAALEDLRRDGGGRYSAGRLGSAITQPGLEPSTGSWEATDWCQGADVLIVAPGPSGVTRRTDIERYIVEKEPMVIALNVVPPVETDLVDCLVACHPVRALIDGPRIAESTKPVFMPEPIRYHLGDLPFAGEVRDYGLTVSTGELAIGSTECVLPRLEAAAYAMALASAGALVVSCSPVSTASTPAIPVRKRCSESSTSSPRTRQSRRSSHSPAPRIRSRNHRSMRRRSGSRRPQTRSDRDLPHLAVRLRWRHPRLQHREIPGDGGGDRLIRRRRLHRLREISRRERRCLPVREARPLLRRDPQPPTGGR